MMTETTTSSELAVGSASWRETILLARVSISWRSGMGFTGPRCSRISADKGRRGGSRTSISTNRPRRLGCTGLVS